MIPKGKDTGTKTITIFPAQDETNDDDLEITIGGTPVTDASSGFPALDGTTPVLTTESILILADDEGTAADSVSDRVRLTVDKPTLKDEDDVMDVKVTATLNGPKIVAGADDVELKIFLAPVELNSTNASAIVGHFQPGEFGARFNVAADAANLPAFADRDDHYDVTSFGSITIAKGAVSGSTTLKIDPRSFSGTVTTRYIMIGARDANAASVLPVVEADGAADPPVVAVNLSVIPALIQINKEAVSQLESILAIPSGRGADMIPESAPETMIPLEVTLKNAPTDDDGQPVKIEINTTKGTRDEDFQVRLGPSLTIGKDSKTGIVNVFVTPKNDDNKDDVTIDVVASVTGSEATVTQTITIVDDDKDTSEISLTGRVVSPEGRENLEIYEEDGTVTIEVTATVDGKPLASDAAVSLTVATDKQMSMMLEEERRHVMWTMS